MRQAFEQQLARSDELPRVPGLVAYIRENEGDSEVPRLYERFMWEMRREKEPRQALQAAKFALSYTPSKEKSLQEALDDITNAVHRMPLNLNAGEHRNIAEGLEIVNLWDHSIWISQNEISLCKQQIAGAKQLIVVCDDTEASARLADQKMIWNVPVFDESSETSFTELWRLQNKGDLPDWALAYSSFRHLADSEQLPSEHQVRSMIARETVQEILLSHSYGPSPEELSAIEPDEMEWAMEQIDLFFDHYTAEPRLALSCHSLKDFSPLADWQQHGPQGQRALIEAVTGNNTLVSEALHSVDRIRIGSLAFTGDPDNNGDDLLSAVLPAQDCTVVLKPETLHQTLFLTGLPYPAAELPVPSSEHGMYNTMAVGREVTEMLKARAYLCLTPATEESIRDYFQGRSDELELEDATGNPAFQALITAVMIRRKQGEDNPMVKAALRVAAAHAIYVGLNSDTLRDPIGGIHLGPLILDDVEQVVVPVRNEHEWEEYHRTGQVPEWLNSAQKFFSSKGIRLRARSHIGHGSMAVAE